MAIAIADTWTEWRIETTSLSVDADYLATQDVAGFMTVVKPKIIRPAPQARGVVDILLRFFDGSGNIVAPDPSTNVDLRFIERIALPPNPGESFTPNDFLQKIGDADVSLGGDERVTAVTDIAFEMLVGVSIVAINQIPVFTKMGIFARFA